MHQNGRNGMKFRNKLEMPLAYFHQHHPPTSSHKMQGRHLLNATEKIKLNHTCLPFYSLSKLMWPPNRVEVSMVHIIVVTMHVVTCGTVRVYSGHKTPTCILQHLLFHLLSHLISFLFTLNPFHSHIHYPSIHLDLPILFSTNIFISNFFFIIFSFFF